MTSSTNNVRDTYWDSLKFILIFLVVLGHTMEINNPDGTINRALYNTIYLFHMPLFIFISGRFSHIKDRDKYKRSIWRLVETYFIFQFIRSVLSPLWTDEQFMLKYIIVPNWIMWYIMCLVWWRLFVYYPPITSILNKQKGKIIMVSIGICIVGGFIPLGHPLEVQRTLVFFPFFILGYYSTDINIRERLQKIPIWIAIVFILVVFTVFYLFLNIHLAWLLSAGQHYWHSSPSTWIRLVSRIIYLPCAFIASIMVMRLIIPNRWFAKWGRETMFIYIYHPFILDVIRILIKNGWIDKNQILLYAYALLVMFFLIILSKVKFFKTMMNPISSLRC